MVEGQKSTLVLLPTVTARFLGVHREDLCAVIVRSMVGIGEVARVLFTPS